MSANAPIAIVGAGLIGAGIAYELAKRGADVVVYDRAEPGRGASWAGAGMLAPFSEEMPDAEMLGLCRASLERYPAFVAELRERTGVDARLIAAGTLHVALDDASLTELYAHAATYARNGGNVQLLDRGQTLAREPAVARDVAGSVFIANEAQVDNRRLGRALVAAATALGVRFEHADELALEADARRVRGLRSARGFIPAEIVVNAAGAWAGQLAGVPLRARLPVVPVAGEMVALGVPRDFLHTLVWSGHTYLVPRDDGRLLIGATVRRRGFDARVTAGGVAELLASALRAAPSLAQFALVETWAGLRPGSPDGRPFLGRTSLDGYIVAAGHYRNGILLTPITASAVAAQICGDADAPDLAPFALGRAHPGEPVSSGTESIASIANRRV